jgi:hypothetical protein
MPGLVIQPWQAIEILPQNFARQEDSGDAQLAAQNLGENEILPSVV